VTVKLSRTPGSVRTAPPKFGESTVEVLTSIGYTADRIKRFSEKGII
jgi:formyl-CoA transferase/CoA:oxalate CoA-transferase